MSRGDSNETCICINKCINRLSVVVVIQREEVKRVDSGTMVWLCAKCEEISSRGPEVLHSGCKVTVTSTLRHNIITESK